MKLRTWAVLGIILVGVIVRWLPHSPNFTPVAALALFGGTYFANKKLAFLIPMIAMFVSDLFLGLHVLMPVVYLAFAVTVVCGMWLRERKSIWSVGGTAFISSAFFFVVTNFGSWLVMPQYSKNFSGLVTCFVAAIPFWSNSLAGDLLYTALFFGAAELLLRSQSRLCVDYDC
jgi:hypothetical protein